MVNAFQRYNTRAARLTPMQVYEIRLRYSQGETQGALCRAFQVSIGTIGRIVRGETWRQYQGERTEQTSWTPIAPNLDDMERTLAEMQKLTDGLPPEREAELMEKLNDSAGKDAAIQAEKSLDELTSPKAKRFLE